MKVDAKTLFEVVRQVVQDEVKKVLPDMVRQHLAESYVKRIVQETANRSSRKQTMAEILTTPKEDELEEIPEPLHNDDHGIYNDRGLDKHDESVSKLMSSNNPLAFVFEGVKPIPAEGEADTSTSIPIEKAGLNFDVMNKLVEGMERKSSKGEMSTPEMKMRELEMKRRALEVKVR